MKYRKSTERDCQAVYELICELEACTFDYDKFKMVYDSQQKDDRYYCLLGEAEGRIIGVLNLRFEAQLHHEVRVAEILEFLVLSDYRGKGTGKDMFALAEGIAKDHGCGEIEVTSNQRRKDAHRFYLREGMTNSHFKFTKKL